MKQNRLGQTDIKISQIALGTMTWGEQNSREEAFTQMDCARDHGINFFDTAELYAIPPKAESYGATETIIGEWFKNTGRRSEVILASKVCGPTAWCPHIRGGRAKLDRSNIITACDESLQRLQTDYIDIYQTHWPERSTNYFGKLNYKHEEESFTAIAETLEALSGLVEAGKVRHIGISNETPWGAMQYLRCAELMGLSRIVSIQNPYNLLNRSFEIGLAEISCREKVGLLAYSPLAFGVLSGKYLNDESPKEGRLSMFGHYTRYSNLYGKLATAAYVEVARKHGLNPAQMALAFIRQQPFVSSTIIGATTMAQLIDNIASHEVILSDECCADIETVFQQYPNPCP
ncbi:NADP(H)-dependent aldo-keto reductase [Mariprofundus sp. NF]|uniref:NADP(H)-dependent aldo-keto reductase n=1 Tax=Mariprofundus sp. NF TaxID=2608716 RepID=UPI0015A4CDB0|nr:NADP(H)-dependent aldo-keto reductase [Mariprofundus sp. NF]NWF38181.1 NADP(H)-dependent aldo-keto reductase [Mariprofundus sp. NF]